jgi:hypothetical protein
MESRIAFLIIADFWVLVKGNKPCVRRIFIGRDLPWLEGYGIESAGARILGPSYSPIMLENITAQHEMKSNIHT